MIFKDYKKSMRKSIEAWIEEDCEDGDIIRVGKKADGDLILSALYNERTKVCFVVLESTSKKEDVEKVINYLNQQTGRSYKMGARTRNLILKCLNYGGADQICAVIDQKKRQWYGTEMAQYLRPSTLFGPKFEEYLQEALHDEYGHGMKELKKLSTQMKESEHVEEKFGF